MNKLQLYRLLRRHVKLSSKRGPIHDQNRWAKLIIFIMIAFAITYLAFLSVPLALLANSSRSYTPYEYLFGLLPYILALDFVFRFVWQKTPAQLIKPYSLMPIPKYACVEFFIYSNAISSNNLYCNAITIPYVIMTTLFSEGVMTSIAVILACQLLIIVNCQWYMLIRTLINRSLIWWLLPIAVYALLFMPVYTGAEESFFRFFSTWGDGFAKWHIIPWIAVFAAFWVFVEINKRVQYKTTYTESNGATEKPLHAVTELNLLNRYGEVGEYLKLEVKSLMRNKNMRKTFIFGVLTVTFFSLAISFTDLYEDSFSKTFFVVYTFVLFGAVMLIKIMCAEGNYIDGLMIHKENIMQLLKAKYYFYSGMLMLPFLLMLPTVFTGKYSLLMLVSMMCFAAGPVYCMLMQMAVYNRQTIPLNTKFVGKGSLETNYFQVVAELLAMFAPVAFISVLRMITTETATFIILLIIGAAFIVTNNWWIKNIYTRFMKKRYQNMEAFRASK